MKIGLINPAQKYEPDNANPGTTAIGGVIFIEAALREKGYDVKTINFEHDLNANLSNVDDCDIIGITTYIGSYGFLKDALPTLKSKNKTIIVGGSMISSYGHKDNLVMKIFPEIDYTVIGEGEKTIIGLVRYLKGKQGLPPGVLYREANRVKSSGLSELVENLDNLPVIDYHRWIGFTEAVEGRPLNLPQFARGCPYHCKFCYRISDGVRVDSIEDFEKRMTNLAKLKPRSFMFSDDTFTYNRKRTVNLTNILKKIGIPYSLMTRVNAVDRKLMRNLKKSGCYTIMFGVESFDQSILDSADKKISLETICNAIKLSQEAGIRTQGFIIVGLPGENKDSIKKTIEGIKKTKVIPQPRIFIPLPGTVIYNNALEQGLINEETLFKQFAEPDKFDTKHGDWVPLNMTQLSDKELIEARDKIWELRTELETYWKY